MKKENEEISGTGRYARRGHFEPDLRDELIKEIEAGTPRSVIVYQYGVSRTAISKWMRDHSSRVLTGMPPNCGPASISRTAISKWMRDHSSEAYQLKRGSHLTEAEKRSIVGQVEQGELTAYAARKAHGISGDTLNKWLRSSVKENAELAAYDPFEMKGTSTGQPDPEKEALKKALEEAQLKISALNTLIDVAEGQFKIRIRKKAGARQS